MTKRKAFIWIICFFVVVVFVPFSFLFAKDYVGNENYENREKAERPKLSISNLESFPKKFEEYYNDNLPYRNQLISLNNSIDFHFFKQSSSEKVVIGKDNWLFYNDDEDYNPIKQSLGYWTFTEEQLRDITESLKSTARVLQDFGIEFVLFIAPNKETVYKDKLPSSYEVKDEMTGVQQLVKYIRDNTDLRVVYPYEELQKARGMYPDTLFYYKLDTHWNNAGGYIGAKSLAEELNVNLPELKDVELISLNKSRGDLANIININIKNGDLEYELSNISDNVTFCEKDDFFTEFIYHTPKSDNRKLFVKRDSFASALAPHIATQFEDSIYVYNDAFDQQQIFDYGSDIFVLETVERYIGEIANSRISYIKKNVEEDGKGNKTLKISPAISGVDLQNVTILKQIHCNDNIEKIQELRPLQDELILEVSDAEYGQITVQIYSDKEGQDMMEEFKFHY